MSAFVFTEWVHLFIFGEKKLFSPVADISSFSFKEIWLKNGLCQSDEISVSPSTNKKTDFAKINIQVDLKLHKTSFLVWSSCRRVLLLAFRVKAASCVPHLRQKRNPAWVSICLAVLRGPVQSMEIFQTKSCYRAQRSITNCMWKLWI